MKGLFQAVPELVMTNIGLSCAIAILWGVLAGVALSVLPRPVRVPVVSLCATCGLYRALVAFDYIAYGSRIKNGFQFTPAALIPNALLVVALIWVLVMVLRRAGGDGGTGGPAPPPPDPRGQPRLAPRGERAGRVVRS